MAADIRVLIADDEPLARRGVRQLLACQTDISVVGGSRNGLDTLRALDELRPDLLFLDVQMPEMEGFEVVRARGSTACPQWYSSPHTINLRYRHSKLTRRITW